MLHGAFTSDLRTRAAKEEVLLPVLMFYQSCMWMQLNVASFLCLAVLLHVLSLSSLRLCICVCVCVCLRNALSKQVESLNRKGLLSQSGIETPGASRRASMAKKEKNLSPELLKEAALSTKH